MVKVSGLDIANNGATGHAQDVSCPWCHSMTKLALNVQHVQNDLSLHCAKCGKFSMHKTADRWFDQHQERMDELKNVWKKIPNDAYVSCRQSTRGTPFIYTLVLSSSKRPEEFMSRDSVEHILCDEFGMSWKQANGILLSAGLTPGQRIYLQRWTRLLMAADAREEMKRTGKGKEFLGKETLSSKDLLRAGTSVRCGEQEGIFLRYSANDGFAIIALPAGPDQFGDAEVPVMDLEIIDAGGPEVVEDFVMDKADDELGMGDEEGSTGLEEALEHIEQAEEIVEDLVLDDVSDHPDDEHKEKAEEYEEDEADEADEAKDHEETLEDDLSEKGDTPFEAGKKRGGFFNDFEDEYNQDEPPSCPMCHGPGMSMGSLGRKEHFRCRNCGMQFSIDQQPQAPHHAAIDPTVQRKLSDLRRVIDDPHTDPGTLQAAQTQWAALKKQVPRGARKKLAFFSYRTKKDVEVSERPEHKTKAPKTKEHKSDLFPKEDSSYPKKLKEDSNLNKMASRDAQRRVRNHFSYSGDLKRAIDVNRNQLSVEDIRDICKFYANTGKIAHHEADDIARWFIGTKPRLLCARDVTASECTCEGAYDRYCPEHGARENKHPRTRANALSAREIRATEEAGNVEVPDAHPESGVSEGSGAEDLPDPKRQSGESANSITGPEKVKEHGAGDSPKDAGDVDVPDLGAKSALSVRDLRTASKCKQCGETVKEGYEHKQDYHSEKGNSSCKNIKSAARHKDGCGCGFCSRAKENSDWGKSRKPQEKEASLSKQANQGIGIFMPALHNSNRVLVIAIDNTSLRATVQDGEGNQRQVDIADLEPVKVGPYSGFAKKERGAQ